MSYGTQTTDTYLLTFTGVLTAKPQVLPVYVDVDVEVAEGLLTSPSDQSSESNEQRSSSDDQWSALLDMYTRSICPADITAITGHDGQSNVLYCSN